MADLPQDPVQELKAVLSEHLPWHGARTGFLAHFLLALLKVRSVNLAELATGFGGKAKVESHYKRLQRFFRRFEVDQDSFARLLVRLVPVGDGPWQLTLDRTNWKFGKAEVNFLVLGVAYRGMAVPVFWSVLDKAGNSGTAERIALMERFLKAFGASRVAALLAGREFVGEEWFRWLHLPASSISAWPSTIRSPTAKALSTWAARVSSKRSRLPRDVLPSKAITVESPANPAAWLWKWGATSPQSSPLRA